MSTLIERLRNPEIKTLCADMREAADEIKRLRTALEQIAAIVNGGVPMTSELWRRIDIARDTLQQYPVMEPANLPPSTLARGDEIEADFYRLKAQEWACETESAKIFIENLLKGAEKIINF